MRAAEARRRGTRFLSSSRGLICGDSSRMQSAPATEVRRTEYWLDGGIPISWLLSERALDSIRSSEESTVLLFQPIDANAGWDRIQQSVKAALPASASASARCQVPVCLVPLLPTAVRDAGRVRPVLQVE